MEDDRRSSRPDEEAAVAMERVNTPASHSRPLRWLAAAMLILTAIIVPFLLFEERILGWIPWLLEALRARPLLGAAVLLGLLAGDVVLPTPSSLVSVSVGAAFGWRAGAALIWAGMTLGCLFGYGLGRSAGRLLMLRLVGEGELARAGRLFTDVGPAAMVLARGVPVLAEASVLAAGAARMPLGAFLVSTSLANAAIALAYGLLGAAAEGAHSFLILFLGLAFIPTLGWSLWRMRRQRAPRSPRG